MTATQGGTRNNRESEVQSHLHSQHCAEVWEYKSNTRMLSSHTGNGKQSQADLSGFAEHFADYLQNSRFGVRFKCVAGPAVGGAQHRNTGNLQGFQEMVT